MKMIDAVPGLAHKNLLCLILHAFSSFSGLLQTNTATQNYQLKTAEPHNGKSINGHFEECCQLLTNTQFGLAKKTNVYRA